MRLHRLPIASWACFVILLREVKSSPQLAFPINSQVPPIAYASQPYQFSFSESTFQADLPIASYSLTNAPNWLSLDSSQRSLYGTPTPGDIGATFFQVQASDGSVEASSEVTLVVVDRPSIALGSSILPSLEVVGPVSAPSTLLLKPLEAFSLTFPANIFSGTSASTKYYAISENSSPLPPWIQFDPTALYFTGMTPTLLSPSDRQQFYGISLIASNVPGFAEVSINFQIAISFRTLSFSSTVTSLTVERGAKFNTPPLLRGLSLDGASLDRRDIASVDADLPDWMNLNQQNLVLSGTVPGEFQSGAFDVRVKDTFGNTANVTLQLQTNATSTNQTDEKLSTTAVTGEYFSYTLPTSIAADSNSVTVDLQNAPEWLTFTNENLTFHGQVPNDFQLQDLITRFSTSTAGGSMNFDLSIYIVRNPAILSSTMMATPTSSSVTSDLPAPTEHTQSNDNVPRYWTRNVILVTVLVGLVVVICIILLILCLRKRSRRKEKGKVAEESIEAGRAESVQNQAAEASVPDTVDLPPIAESSRKTSVSRQTPTQAPQVDLPWAPDSLQKTKERMSKRLQKRDQRSFDSSWGGLVTRSETRSGPGHASMTPFGAHPPNGTVPPLPPPIPVYAPKRQSATTKASSARENSGRQQRSSKVSNAGSHRPIGLPQRRSGAGHGSGILTADTNLHRSSWQTTLGSIPLAESRPSTTALDAFPAPPLDGKENQAPEITKPSLRLVDASSEPSENFENQRQRWHTERARDRLEGGARFSNAGSFHSFSLPRGLGGSTFSPSGTISPTIPENESFRSPSWSKWSGVGPAARGISPMSTRAPAPLFASRPTPRLAREVSFASSGQFDSALSSDSQWEDDNLIAEVNEAGERQWHTDTESAAPSPRLPFGPFSSSQEELAEVKQAATLRGARLIDKRRRVSVEDAGIRRNEKSRVGSFRFI